MVENKSRLSLYFTYGNFFHENHLFNIFITGLDRFSPVTWSTDLDNMHYADSYALHYPIIIIIQIETSTNHVSSSAMFSPPLDEEPPPSPKLSPHVMVV